MVHWTLYWSGMMVEDVDNATKINTCVCQIFKYLMVISFINSK